MLDWLLLTEVMGSWLALSLLAGLFLGRMIDLGTSQQATHLAGVASLMHEGEQA